MKIDLIIVSVLAIFSSLSFASDGLGMIEKEKQILVNTHSYPFNLALYQKSPIMYETVTNIINYQQLNDIKILLEKITENQEKLLSKIE